MFTSININLKLHCFFFKDSRQHSNADFIQLNTYVALVKFALVGPHILL